MKKLTDKEKVLKEGEIIFPKGWGKIDGDDFYFSELDRLKAKIKTLEGENLKWRQKFERANLMLQNTIKNQNTTSHISKKLKKVYPK